MTTAKDIVGQWRGERMCRPQPRFYDVLVFHADGTGFLDQYNDVDHFSETFRWGIDPAGELRLDDRRRTEVHSGVGLPREAVAVPGAVTAVDVRQEQTNAMGPARVLRFPSPPWAGMADRYLFYRGDVPTSATFQAPCFERDDEAADPTFRGKALSDYLARQLKARRVRVSPRQRVYMGACYYRWIEIRNRTLGLAVNAAEEGPGWWLRLDRPAEGGVVELIELHRHVDDILRGVAGMSGLVWQTDDEWRAEAGGTTV